jgi:hypothetical protein
VIRELVEGRADSIKERTIAIDVFGKSPHFDPGSDSLVRVKAREVRKRLAEYYESTPNAPLRIELPIGSYIPIIRATDAASATDSPKEDLALEPVEAERSEETAEEVRKSVPRFVVLLATVLTTAAAIGLSAVIWTAVQRPHAENPVQEVWSPLLDNPNNVLITTGRPVTPQGEELEPPQLTIKEHFRRPEFRVTLTTADAIVNIAGFLQRHDKPFRIHDSASNTLSDLHERPVVLINGDNRWTLSLLRPTRFDFVSEGDFSYIQDSKNPSQHNWNVDFTQLFRKQITDYAIVGRFNSATTGGPVIVVAGISSNGTEAAGEFIVSPKRLSELLRLAPPGWKNGNFEAVLKVEVIDGNTGASSIVASEFW